MKIGILTLPLHTNYGGILQAYALQTILERMGHEVEVINKERIPQLEGAFKYFQYIKRAIHKYVLRREVSIFFERRKLCEYKILTQDILPFIQERIHNHIVRDVSELKQSDFDAIVVGSDQIWRPRYIKSVLRESIESAFLSFAQEWNIKRISYAASFGTDEWEYTPEETLQVRNLLQKFDAVSVREESGIGLCKDNLGVDAMHVLDPTMLLNKDDYEALLGEGIKENNNYMLSYVLNATPEMLNLINNIATDKKLINKPIVIRDNGDGKTVQPSVMEWLKSFRDARFVITDSFHACVFSILFRKPFVAVGNKIRGYGRFLSLMKMLGLENNLISDPSEYNVAMSYEISDSTYLLLDAMRIKSMQYLQNALSYEYSQSINNNSHLQSGIISGSMP